VKSIRQLAKRVADAERRVAEAEKRRYQEWLNNLTDDQLRERLAVLRARIAELRAEKAEEGSS
jgi:hypothetical protein